MKVGIYVCGKAWALAEYLNVEHTVVSRRPMLYLCRAVVPAYYYPQQYIK